MPLWDTVMIRAGDWVYHWLLLLGPHSMRWQRWQGIGIHAAADKLFTEPRHCGSRRISLKDDGGRSMGVLFGQRT